MATYAVSDLHGRLDLYKKIKSFLKPEDIVYCLGDCGDRGPEPWETIKAVYRDPQFIYLKGNHEDLLVQAANDLIKYDYVDYSWSLLASNGGYDTFDQWAAEENRVMWWNALKNLPILKKYINKDGTEIYLSHAGFDIQKESELQNISEKDLLWDRNHFFNQGPFRDNTIFVHGHTPITYLVERLNCSTRVGAFWYADRAKVCIDNSSYSSGITCLFDLDTFNEKIFTEAI